MSELKHDELQSSHQDKALNNDATNSRGRHVTYMPQKCLSNSMLHADDDAFNGQTLCRIRIPLRKTFLQETKDRSHNNV